jgi:hypothetical protein
MPVPIGKILKCQLAYSALFCYHDHLYGDNLKKAPTTNDLEFKLSIVVMFLSFVSGL